jgi:hypothetical protein
MRSRLVSSLFLAAGVCVHAGCARHLSHGLVDRFMVHRESQSTGKLETPPPTPSLEEAIAKLRRLMAEARPQKANATPSRSALPTTSADCWIRLTRITCTRCG